MVVEGTETHLDDPDALRVLSDFVQFEDRADHEEDLFFVGVVTERGDVAEGLDVVQTGIGVDLEEDFFHVVGEIGGGEEGASALFAQTGGEEGVHGDDLAHGATEQADLGFGHDLRAVDADGRAAFVLRQLLFDVANEEAEEVEQVDVLHAQGFVEETVEEGVAGVPPERAVGRIVQFELFEDLQFESVVLVELRTQLDEFALVFGRGFHSDETVDEQLKVKELTVEIARRLFFAFVVAASGGEDVDHQRVVHFRVMAGDLVGLDAREQIDQLVEHALHLNIRR